MSKTSVQLGFKNGELVNVYQALQGYKLKGRASLGRTWLGKRLADANKQFNEDRTATQKVYFKTDDDGEFVYQADKKTLILKDDYTMAEAQSNFDELINEEITIDVSQYSARIKSLYQALEDYPYELEGQTAEVYAVLFDELDKAFGKGDK
ncbi:DUF1617 family protein [Lactiplantibacillus plantarum]|uniref:DUF1617 family protein n=1 Tax=Lactiplantibacillus plantarum TaxID=1590 RepID=UPI0007C67CE0|nr:DUF1617 family protein [Lactiplantibacillus plantarum]OAH23386.1 hypothetical protein AYJ51_01285 [Lactiplantibacillus plantarum]